MLEYEHAKDKHYRVGVAICETNTELCLTYLALLLCGNVSIVPLNYTVEPQDRLEKIIKDAQLNLIAWSRFDDEPVKGEWLMNFTKNTCPMIDVVTCIENVHSEAKRPVSPVSMASKSSSKEIAA